MESTSQGNPASARSRDGPVDTWDADGCPRGPAESRVERITHSHPPGDTRRHLDRGAGVSRVRPYDGQRRVVIRRRRARAGAAAVPCVPGAPINGRHLGTRSVSEAPHRSPPLLLCPFAWVSPASPSVPSCVGYWQSWVAPMSRRPKGFEFSSSLAGNHPHLLHPLFFLFNP